MSEQFISDLKRTAVAGALRRAAEEKLSNIQAASIMQMPATPIAWRNRLIDTLDKIEVEVAMTRKLIEEIKRVDTEYL